MSTVLRTVSFGPCACWERADCFWRQGSSSWWWGPNQIFLRISRCCPWIICISRFRIAPRLRRCTPCPWRGWGKIFYWWWWRCLRSFCWVRHNFWRRTACPSDVFQQAGCFPRETSGTWAGVLRIVWWYFRNRSRVFWFLGVFIRTFLIKFFHLFHFFLLSKPSPTFWTSWSLYSWILPLAWCNRARSCSIFWSFSSAVCDIYNIRTYWIKMCRIILSFPMNHSNLLFWDLECASCSITRRASWRSSSVKCPFESWIT